MAGGGSGTGTQGRSTSLFSPTTGQLPDQCPADLPALWSICHTKDPAKAKPYQAPDGRSGMYMLDECCTQEGHVWRSVIDDNVWPPSGYPDGWEDLGVPGE